MRAVGIVGEGRRAHLDQRSGALLAGLLCFVESGNDVLVIVRPHPYTYACIVPPPKAVAKFRLGGIVTIRSRSCFSLARRGGCLAGSLAALG